MIYPVVRKNLGYCLYWLRRYDEAYEEHKQASDMDPKCAWTQYNLGVLHQLNRSEEAIEHLKKAIELEPLWANAHNTLGLTLAEVGRTDEALSQFDRAFSIFIPRTSMWATTIRTSCSRKRGRYRKATIAGSSWGGWRLFGIWQTQTRRSISSLTSAGGRHCLTFPHSVRSMLFSRSPKS